MRHDNQIRSKKETANETNTLSIHTKFATQPFVTSDRFLSWKRFSSLKNVWNKAHYAQLWSKMPLWDYVSKLIFLATTYWLGHRHKYFWKITKQNATLTKWKCKCAVNSHPNQKNILSKHFSKYHVTLQNRPRSLELVWVNKTQSRLSSNIEKPNILTSKAFFKNSFLLLFFQGRKASVISLMWVVTGEQHFFFSTNETTIQDFNLIRSEFNGKIQYSLWDVKPNSNNDKHMWYVSWQALLTS